MFFCAFLQDWSLKYDQDNPVQPRYDLNAPDLYIPTMSYITFVVMAGLVMGNFPSALIHLHFFSFFHFSLIFRNAKPVHSRTVGCYFVKCTCVHYLRIDCVFNHIICIEHIVYIENT